MAAELLMMDAGTLGDEVLTPGFLERLPSWRRPLVLAMRPGPGHRLALASGMLLGLAMRREGIPLDACVLFGAHGKPFLRDFPSFHFNLSHSGHRALLALGNREVGCDVQKVVPCRMNVSEKYFSRLEVRALRLASEGPERDRLFSRLWAVRESCLKSSGLGLSAGLSGLTVSLDEDGGTTVRTQGGLQMRPFEPTVDGEYVLACSLWGEDARCCTSLSALWAEEVIAGLGGLGT